ncbi:MAG: iron-containing alcohol dehydrogenase [Chloroflexaceae bacterium]|jgi:alcohol dehydrogenase class IV|nr:iron-containing alcohol dehydrogenase [Chloroflexaceae bacterium]
MPEFFEFSLGARVLYKAGLARDFAGELDRLGGSRAFIVADKGVSNAGLLEPVKASLHGNVELVGVFDDVPPNSSVEVVEAAAAQAQAAGADLLVAVGGGSPMDTAKGMRMLITLGGQLLDHQGYNLITQRLVPMVAIPTTAGTGSEASPFAVILDTEQNVKLAFASPYLVPELAILDPEMTRTMPPRLTAATGMDALTHAIECYVSTDTSPMSDAMALQAMTMIAANLHNATHHGDNLEARGNMLIASCLAGIAFSNGFLGAVHALAHATGGKFHVHHGTANAIFLPHVMSFNSSVVPDRYVRIAHALGVDTAGMGQADTIGAGIQAVRALMRDCGLPMRLRDVDVPESALPAIAELALTDAAIFNNPRPADTDDLMDLLRAAW